LSAVTKPARFNISLYVNSTFYFSIVGSTNTALDLYVLAAKTQTKTKYVYLK